MKKIILCLALLSISHTLLFGNGSTNIPTPLTREETRSLSSLFWNKKNASSFAQGLTDAELTYSMYVLTKNIVILETMSPENSWQKKKELMTVGGLGAILYSGMSSLLVYGLYKKHYQFITGTFENAFVSKEKVDNLSSARLSLKEKKYLRSFKAKNIIIGDQGYWASSWNKERTEEIMSKMSRRNKEKLTYYALKETVNLHKSRFLRDSFMPCFLIIATIGILAATLYGVIYQQELLESQLEDCKNLYRIFKGEQERRLSLVKKLV